MQNIHDSFISEKFMRKSRKSKNKTKSSSPRYPSMFNKHTGIANKYQPKLYAASNNVKTRKERERTPPMKKKKRRPSKTMPD